MFIGDLVGEPGLALFAKWAPVLKEKYKINATIVNAENSAKNGNGVSSKNITFLKEHGADVITTGNHAFDCKDVYTMLSERNDVIRPTNYPPGCPGKGHTLIEVENQTVAVVNVHGRIFVRELLDCPFRAMDSLLGFLKHKTKIILVDFHGEATSEKKSMGLFLDGKVTALVGTHTHVQSADQMILPKGTGYMTDLGSAGALYSVIGFQEQGVLNRYLIHHRFGQFAVETKGPMVLSGVWIEVDVATGKTIQIEPIRVIDEEIAATIPQEKDTHKSR